MNCTDTFLESFRRSFFQDNIGQVTRLKDWTYNVACQKYPKTDVCVCYTHKHMKWQQYGQPTDGT